jgi:hypothetical protein
MQRKLITVEAFENLEKGSLSSAGVEILEATNLIGEATGLGSLSMRFFDADRVVFETQNGTYLHANYKVTNNQVILENLTELAINTNSIKTKIHECLSKLFEAVSDDNILEADMQFERYMELFIEAHRSGLNKQIVESINESKGGKKMPEELLNRFKKGKGEKALKETGKFKKKCMGKNVSKHTPDASKFVKGAGKDRKLKEWAVLAENVSGYVNIMNGQSERGQVRIHEDQSGNVVAVAVPTSQARNEGKLLSVQLKTLKSDLKVMRESAKYLGGNSDFIKAVVALKRLNNLSHDDELHESIENLVAKNPGLLYLSEREITELVKGCLIVANETNFEDQTCKFIAEGILRVAHQAFSDRAGRVVELAGEKLTGPVSYDKFREVSEIFFPKLDEALHNEMQVYVDLYNALVDIHEFARNGRNSHVADQASSFLTDLKPVVEGTRAPMIGLASEAAEWICAMTEANLEGANDQMDVSNDFVTSYKGDHPVLAGKARQPGHPAFFDDVYGGGPAPVSDGGQKLKGNEVEMQNRGFGNKGGKDTWPTLDNPYVPKPFNFTLNNEPGVDKNSDDSFGQFQDGDTVPNLSNPYIPKAIIFQANDSNLVTNK